MLPLDHFVCNTPAMGSGRWSARTLPAWLSRAGGYNRGGVPFCTGYVGKAIHLRQIPLMFARRAVFTMDRVGAPGVACISLAQHG